MKQLSETDLKIGMKVKILEKPPVWNDSPPRSVSPLFIHESNYPLIGEIVSLVITQRYPAVGIKLQGCINEIYGFSISKTRFFSCIPEKLHPNITIL
jgi:hypothetical protein